MVSGAGVYGVIYTATNRINGKQYVGQTTATVEKRWAAHVSEAIHRRRNGCRALQNAIRKYGADAFRVEAVIACDDQEELDRFEAMAIASGETLTPGGYNLKTGGGNGRHSAESRAKISEALKGKNVWSKGYTRSSEARAKIGAANKGKILSLETRAKIGVASRVRFADPEVRAKISAAKKGKTLTPEHRAKLSMARKGKKMGPPSLETRAKIGAAQRGKKRGPHSYETRAKISAALKGKRNRTGYRHSPETRAKISVANKRRSVIAERNPNGEH